MSGNKSSVSAQLHPQPVLRAVYYFARVLTAAMAVLSFLIASRLTETGPMPSAVAAAIIGVVLAAAATALFSVDPWKDDPALLRPLAEEPKR